MRSDLIHIFINKYNNPVLRILGIIERLLLARLHHLPVLIDELLLIQVGHLLRLVDVPYAVLQQVHEHHAHVVGPVHEEGERQ